MTVSTEPSTFEFTRDWLVSSEAFVRDAMLADALSLDESRDQARARIHREEALDEANEDGASETAPNSPPPIASRPRAIVITRDDSRTIAGTGTWGGRGVLLVCIEVITPEEYREKAADDNAAARAEKFAGRKLWARRLCNTIRLELLGTSGRGDANGVPYLNARRIDIYVQPNDPEDGESTNWMAWVYEVEWL